MSKINLNVWVIEHYEKGWFKGFVHGIPRFDNSVDRAVKCRVRYYLSADEAMAVLGYFQKLYPDVFNKCYMRKVVKGFYQNFNTEVLHVKEKR